MAARGTLAKQQVENLIRTAFGDNFAGSDGKALYVWSEENGEKVQIKISLTCPKTEYNGPDIATGNKSTAKAVLDWSGNTDETPVTELTQDEKEIVNNLLEKLGL